MASALHSNCLIRLSSSDSDSGIEVTVDYACFLSLEMERVWGDSANKFTLKLLDRTAYEVETIVLAGSRNIYFRLYSDDGEKTVKDPKEFAGSIWDYSVDFINDKTILTLTGTCGVNVKDIYTLYNRLWNKVPVVNETIMEAYEASSGAKGIKSDVKSNGIKFRYVTTDSGEDKFQVSFYSNNTYDKKGNLTSSKPVYFDCDMINIPVRPSDIVELIASGGKMSRLSPFDSHNKDIKYDDFADSGFNFGSYTETDENGNSKTGTITWSKALEWRETYQDYITGGNTTDLFGQWYLKGTEKEVNAMESEQRLLIGRVIADVNIIEEYFKKLGSVESSGWNIGHIEKTEPICADLSQVKLSNTKFISDVLASKSFTSMDKNNSTRANYYLYFEDGKVYFEPSKIEAKPKAKVIVGQYLNPNIVASREEGVNTYAGDMIISYSYTSNTAAYIAGSGANELAGISYVTGEAISADGLSSKSKEQLGVVEATYTDFNQGALPTLGGTSSTNISDLIAKAQSDWKALAATSFKAEVQILGNLGLKCGDYIEIINLPGGNLGKHHTSGIYLIMKIKENISRGTYLSTLTLVKNAANSGSGVSTTSSGGSSTSGNNSSISGTSGSGGGGGSSF